MPIINEDVDKGREWAYVGRHVVEQWGGAGALEGLARGGILVELEGGRHRR